MIAFDENGFWQDVETKLKPWLANFVTDGRFTSFDGTKIHYYRAQKRECLQLLVSEQNETAQKFYFREGFQIKDRLEGQAGELLLLECPLSTLPACVD